MKTLFIHTDIIGPGFFIQHGFSTIIGAKSIGSNCSINQQVTIGFKNEFDCPTIEDNVTITAGVIIVGNARIGKNSVIGANSVIVKDVPENCTIIGNPAYIIKRDGQKVKEYI